LGLILIDPPALRNARAIVAGGPALLWRRLRSVVAGAYLSATTSLRARIKLFRGGRSRRDMIHRLVGSVVLSYFFPKRYAGDMLVVHSGIRALKNEDPEQGLSRLLGRPVTFVEIGKDHEALFTTEIERVALAIKSYLERIDASRSKVGGL
jgi:hypothetical protein